MNMKNKAFIYTMDVVLAFIPVFIILGTVSTLSTGSGLFSRGFVLGSGRIAQDTLEVMSARGSLEDTNITRVNETLNKLLPSYLNYTYEVEFNDTLLMNISTGNISAAQDVVVARRTALLQLYAVSSEVLEIAHLGSDATPECCSGPGAQQRGYSHTFTLTQEDLDTYDFWFYGELLGGTVTTKWGIDSNYILEGYAYTCEVPPENCPTGGGPNPGQQEDFGANDFFRVQLTPVSDYLQAGQNTMYLELGGNGDASYYVLRTPKNTTESTVTPENAKVMQLVVATLKVFR